MHYVGVGKRAVAIIMDTVVFFILAIPASMLWGENYAERTEQGFSMGFSISGAAFFIPVGVWFLYFVIMEATVGATIGKLVMGIRVRKEDGGKISWGESLIRNVLRLVDGFAFYLVGAIIVWTGGKEKQQRLGDMAAKTIVLPKDDDFDVNPQGQIEQTPGLGFKEVAGAPLPTDETPQPPSA